MRWKVSTNEKGTTVRTNPITPDKADVIRARFMARAATLRHEADFMEAAAPQTAAYLRRAADSQERMATKRYESMHIVGSI